MAAGLVLLKNPLKLTERELFILEETPISWLQKNYPNGFDHPIRFFVNEQEKPLDDLDYVPQQGDVIIIAVAPAGAGILGGLLIKLLMSIVMSALSALISMIFAPKQKKSKTEEGESVYAVSSAQNAAKLGEPVPVIYGKTLVTPDYAAQPYTWYNVNFDSTDRQIKTGVQYLDVLLCLGSGDLDIVDLFVGDTNVKNLPAGVFTYQLYKASSHKKRMGNIETTFPGGNFKENVLTSTEVSNQEFIEADDTAGPFILGKRGQRGRTIQNDFVFPGGLYNTDKSDGDVHGNACTLDFTFQEVNDSDTPVGTAITKRYIVSNSEVMANGNAGVVGSPSWLSSRYTKNAALQSSPHRITVTDTMPRSGRWQVTCRRITEGEDARGNNKFIWSGCKLFMDHTTAEVYGDVTLLACRIKATKGLGDDAAIRVSALVQRNIKALGVGNLVATRSPADAFVDIYTDMVYGGRRPLSEIDIVTVSALRTKWAGYEFNYSFDRRVSIWVALGRAIAGVVAEPIPLGSKLTIAQDGIKPVRSMVFNDANIVKGTFRLSYQWDVIDAPDGVEIEYQDNVRYKPAYVRYPSNSALPERINLLGCTSSKQAGEYAIVYWQRRTLQRMLVEFDTELEGLLLILGDRIGVSHSVPAWGHSGLVLAAMGNSLSLDAKMDWSGAGPHYVILRRDDGSATEPLIVTRDGADHKVLLASSPPFTPSINGRMEYTSYTFGEMQTMLRDFTVSTIRPSTNYRVKVEALAYREAIFNNGMPFLGGAQNYSLPASAFSGIIPLPDYVSPAVDEPTMMERVQ